jgi:uncharacterized membrane protein YeaQ/YmgE (transglycosylase-associated protein family)
MIENIPVEISFSGVYFPPIFFVIVFGIIGAFVITSVLNRTGLSKYFWHPPLAFLAMSALISAVIALLFLSP